MTSTDYIPGPNGKKIAVTTSSGEDFLSLNKLHFLLDPDEAPFHAPPRDTKPPEPLELSEVSNANQITLVNQICERCSSINLRNPPSLCNEIDWGGLANSRRAIVEEQRSRGITQIEGYVCDLGHFPEDFNISTCPLCRALASVRTRLLRSPLGLRPWPYELHVVSAAYVHFGIDRMPRNDITQILESRRISDTVIFAVDPKPPHIFFYGRVGFWLTEHSGTSGYLYPVASEEDRMERRFSGRQLQTDHIDYSVVRSWIDSCQTYHLEACASGKSNSLKDTPSFRLIDCHTRQVVSASTEMPYVALSYTWGSGSTSGDTETRSDIPIDGTALVIEDAMTVTKELGLRYLWVDKYCIIQGDLQVKMEQIQNMDAVYDRAEVTIIAAAGENGSFGLPGVSSRHRIAQPSVQVENRLFVSSGPHLRDLLRLSKWASRGWTYQEGLISKRRLIFTEYQTYFECASAHCCEAIDAPPDVLFQEKSVNGANPMASRDFRVFPLGKPIAKAHQIVERIREYASKELTYKSDALNGILGIFAVVEKWVPSISHLWGIPILTQTEITPPPFRSPDSTASGSEWITRDPNEALLIGLRWAIKPTKRNPGFPSWSWTGWAGPLQLFFPSANAEIRPRTNFWVEIYYGHLVEWTEFHASRDHDGKLPPVSRFLHVEGPAVKLEFRWGLLSRKTESFPHQEDKYGLHVLLHVNDLQISICPLHITRWEDYDVQAFVDRLLRGTWDALILSHCGSPLPPETDVLGEEVGISYETLGKEKRTDFELLVLEPVPGGRDEGGDAYYERLGTVKLVFPESLELPSAGLLKVERKRFRIG
ncbi:hypothetical protein GP486_005048 [Trichoglossum hirsutum]|uniref:Heterokaryon incompatibility domain-containing protein n=1 Tax=Trichoglossum hirsutum TaxID=265104 RepID=A0A9P8L9U8_9PEZI|nr:hypothetical protein GP486_005048 [Trichoglossum hirsutum]